MDLCRFFSSFSLKFDDDALIVRALFRLTPLNIRLFIYILRKAFLIDRVLLSQRISIYFIHHDLITFLLRLNSIAIMWIL